MAYGYAPGSSGPPLGVCKESGLLWPAAAGDRLRVRVDVLIVVSGVRASAESHSPSLWVMSPRDTSDPGPTLVAARFWQRPGPPAGPGARPAARGVHWHTPGPGPHWQSDGALRPRPGRRAGRHSALLAARPQVSQSQWGVGGSRSRPGPLALAVASRADLPLRARRRCSTGPGDLRVDSELDRDSRGRLARYSGCRRGPSQGGNPSGRGLWKRAQVFSDAG